MILVLNGPNLNRLGLREPGVYGSQTLEDLERLCEEWGAELGVPVTCRQNNYEGQLLEWIQDAEAHGFSGIVLNPGALTHTSVAIADALSAVSLPVAVTCRGTAPYWPALPPLSCYREPEYR